MSSGERKRKRLNLYRVQACGRCGMGVVGRRREPPAWGSNIMFGVSGRPLGWAGVEGETPVHENTEYHVG